MGGDKDVWFFPSLEGGSRTVVLMGRTGNGKSATGNSILGKKAFESRSSMSSITTTSECLTKTFTAGQVVNVIDTPGLFDSSVEHEFIIKQIVKCIDLAKDGIHAILLVLSVRARFTEEETAAIEGLQEIFGPKITDYMIVVFTGGDSLAEDQSLEDFLSRGCPDPLQKVLHVCKNRMVLFDNKTEDKGKKEVQLQKLFDLVDEVVTQNHGKPYTHLLFSEMKRVAEQHRKEKEELNAPDGRTEEEITTLMKKLQISYEEQFQRMTGMVLASLMETNHKLQKQLEEEKVARLNYEKKSEDEINELRKILAKARKDKEDAKARKAEEDAKAGKCSIM